LTDKRSKLALVLFLVSAVVVLALSVYTGISLHALADALEQSRSERLLAETQAASLIVSADELDAVSEASSFSGEEAAALTRRLDAFAALHDLTELSFIEPLPSGQLHYIISSSSGAGIHDSTAAPFASSEMMEQVLNGSIVVSDLQSPEAESSGLMAYAPVYTPAGTVVAIAAVGIDDTDTIRADTQIRDLTIILLVCIAVVILAACANVLLQLRKEHELEESVSMQKLMVQISQNLASEQAFDSRVSETLGMLGSALGASRSYIANISEPEVQNPLRHYWQSASDATDDGKQTIESEIPLVYPLMLEAFEQYRSAGDTDSYLAVSLPHAEQDLDEGYALLQEAGIRAFIWFPLYLQNDMWGVLVLEFTRAQREFADKDIQLVRSASLDLEGAITRELYSEQREQALDHAVYASEAKSEFLSNMSHEMRTPMNAIIGMTSIALDSAEPARKDYCLRHIEDASAHLLNIINDVLDMSSIQADELSLNYAPFRLRMALDGVVNDHIQNINAHQLAFSLAVDERIPSVLIGDKQRLAKVVGNLLSNAVKFTPEQGFVALRVVCLGTGPEGVSLRFEVEDSGIGIDPAVREKLYGSFEQAESGANRKYGGTGLGLAISRRLVELMGGQIGMESRVNEGSKVFFTVTLAEATPETQAERGVAETTDTAATQTEGSAAQAGTSAAEATPTEAALAAAGAGAPDVLATTESSAVPAAPDESAREAALSDEEQEARVFPPENAPGETPDLSAYRILLAEDIEINREVVLALLEESRIQIDIATNGLEALEAVRNNPRGYDLIFMDLQMPEMDGLDAARKIRALPIQSCATLPIIAMTANVFQEDIDACLDAGMNGHIGKPVSLEEIYLILKRYLPRRVSFT
jgi:signal transduction histidine kinase/CheY-like chemotaxis protein